MIKPDIGRLRGGRSSAVTVERPISRRTVLGLLGASALVHAGCRTSSSASPSGTDSVEPFYYLTLGEIGRRIDSQEVSPVDLTERMLDRIATVDPGLKSYATVMREDALAVARTAEQEIRAGRYRGPLHGVPVGVKDLCFTKGVRTMGGTTVRENFVPDIDATSVSRLRDAGAVLLGKLNLSEGAAAGYNPARDVPLNPWNPDRWPGMSSSGSGVATAAGLCYAAIGTDTGGSRTPFRLARCRTTTRRGPQPRRAPPSSRCPWISRACRRSACRALFWGWSAIWHPVHRPAARRIDAVPHRPCI